MNKTFTRWTSAALAAAVATAGMLLTATPASAATTTVYVAPNGNGTSCTAAAPCALPAAQAAARTLAPSGDVVVQMAGGRYEISSPLSFGSADGGQGDATVTWQAAPGAQPVITGATAVTGWTQSDASKNIWSAAIPAGVDSRDLFVDGKMQQRASLPVSRGDIDLTPTGMTLKTSVLQALAQLPQQNRMEFRAKNNFTDRYAPVVKIADGKAEMAQPAWKNNLWGYDTIPSPGAPHQILSFENSLAFISDPGEWYIDPDAGRLYYKPADGVNPDSLDVELPRLPSLISISGTYDAPIRNLAFTGIQFSGTSWLGPSSPDGLASQQAGAYIKGTRDYFPSDPFSCSNGCAAFERARSTWSQQPAAVQVSAAQNISFTGNRFVNLGQIGLGIGNDANATTSGVGLGAQGVTVRGNIFTQLGGGGIVAGGILADAHHPSRAEMTNSNITIDANTIVGTSFTYQDNSGILSTYVDTATITRNEVAQLPYDGIDIGYGWGINDPGGSPDYEGRGYYQYNTRYDTPTTFTDNTVANNLVHNTKQVFGDGGALYTLSTAPNSVIRDNYVYAANGTIGVYLDEGTSSMLVKNNVLRDIGPWFWMNTDQGRNMRNNIADGNWHMGGYVRGDLSPESGNKVINDHPVSGDRWPTGAVQIICTTGVPAEYRNSLTTDPCPYTNGSEPVDSAAAQQRILDDKKALRDAEVNIDAFSALGNSSEEAARNLKTVRSNSGTWAGQAYRDAERSAGSYFQLEMNVDPTAPKNYLGVRYNGGDNGRSFDVLLNGTKLKTEKITNAQGNSFYTQWDEIPASILQNIAATDSYKKDAAGKYVLDAKGNKIPVVTVRFTADGSGSYVGGIYGLTTARTTTYATDANLSKLTFTTGTLSPTFTGTTKAYTLTVPAGTTSVTFDADPTTPSGLVKVGDILIDDTKPRTLPLTQGTTTRLTLNTLAQDHTTTTQYTVDVVPQAPTPTLSATATASSRCVSGKVVLTVTLTNTSSRTVDTTVATPWGTRTTTALAAGKSTSFAYTTRSKTITAGTATATITATIDGTPTTATTTATYPTRTCK